MEFSQPSLNPRNPLPDSRISYLPETRFGAVPPTVWGNPLMSPRIVMTPKHLVPCQVISNLPDSDSKLTVPSVSTPSYPVAHKYLGPKFNLSNILIIFKLDLFKSNEDTDAEIIRICVMLFFSVLWYLSLLLI